MESIDSTYAVQKAFAVECQMDYVEEFKGHVHMRVCVCDFHLHNLCLSYVFHFSQVSFFFFFFFFTIIWLIAKLRESGNTLLYYAIKIQLYYCLLVILYANLFWMKSALFCMSSSQDFRCEIFPKDILVDLVRCGEVYHKTTHVSINVW